MYQRSDPVIPSIAPPSAEVAKLKAKLKMVLLHAHVLLKIVQAAAHIRRLINEKERVLEISNRLRAELDQVCTGPCVPPSNICQLRSHDVVEHQLPTLTTTVPTNDVPHVEDWPSQQAEPSGPITSLSALPSRPRTAQDANVASLMSSMRSQDLGELWQLLDTQKSEVPNACPASY